ncbi:MAG: S24/S26 family peptidase [Anaerolineales bacterium]|jgi:signal peptidase I|nr:S24/S26 family peptidase [Anaerolineales bacterium]
MSNPFPTEPTSHSLPGFDLTASQLIDLATEILASGASVHFRARGVSMRPIIRDGDLLEITPLASHPPRLGDILLFKLANRQLLVHRVIRTRPHAAGRQFLLQGDAAIFTDGWITAEVVLGKVTAIERNGNLIRLDRLHQRLLAILVAWGMPVFKQIYRRLFSTPSS